MKNSEPTTKGMVDWNYDGIGEAPDGSHYVIDSFKTRGEPRWWTVRYVPVGEPVGHDNRTFAMFPHADTHVAPVGVVIDETSHSERRAQEMAERHLTSRGLCGHRGCKRIAAQGNLGRCTDHGRF